MKKLIVANWKMQFTHNESLAWVHKHEQELIKICKQTDCTFVLCPTFTTLASLTGSLLIRGAQDCSIHEQGAYTGDVSVLSLKELGCSYCIVGHSERRIYCKETTEDIKQKVALLMHHKIEPIFCIGETAEQKVHGSTQKALEQQLLPVLKHIQNEPFNRICIAYEPVWAIGTGKIPTIEELNSVIDWLQGYVKSSFPALSFSLLYGGSVNDKNIQELKNIERLQGFLLGKASTDFHALKYIITAL